MLLTHRRLAKTMASRLAHPERLRKVKKTMARIKRVMHERHTLAMQLALDEFETKKSQGWYKYPIDFNSEEVQQIVRELREEGLVSEAVAADALGEPIMPKTE